MNQTIWFLINKEYKEGIILSRNNNTFKIEYNQKQFEINIQNLYFSNSLSTEQIINTSNLISLTYLHQPSLLHCLTTRYQHNLIYTFTGDVLLAINPYKMIPTIYNDHCKKLIHDNNHYPHVFQIAKHAYHNLLHNNYNQSILISGESGSGKTVSTRFIMNYLTEQDKQISSQEILFSNSILEAFGNAKTIRNNNSSRFGKFIKLHYQNKKILNATITTYLLETIRVTQHSNKERNFHIFYMLLDGLNETQKQQNYLTTCDEYNILNNQNTTTNRNDKQEFIEFSKKLSSFLSENQINELWNLLSTILHIGNITYYDLQENTSLLSIICSLLQIKSEVFINNLLHKTIITKNNEIYQCKLSEKEVLQTITSLCRMIYHSLFMFIVMKINETLNRNIHTTQQKFIGILDIFGFEVLHQNYYEQLLINYTNEYLQRQFNHYFFKKEQELYKKEQIEWTHIQYPDNHHIINLLNNKKTGMFFILNDCCKVNSTSDQFYQSVLKKHQENKNIEFNSKLIARKEFIIKHYAADVHYKTTNIIRKNKLIVTRNLIELLNQIKLPLWIDIMKHTNTNYKKVKNQTQFSKFNQGLTKLMSSIKSTTTHYIRCIKPNDEDLPNKINQERIKEQLEYSGIMEAIKISRLGYPIRFSFIEFDQQFNFYIQEKFFINDIQDLNNKQIQRGESILFMKKNYFLEKQTNINEYYSKQAQLIQTQIRCYQTQQHYIQLRKNTLLIQSHVRKNRKQKQYKQILQKIICIQNSIRQYYSKILYQQLKFQIQINKQATIINQFCKSKKIHYQYKQFYKSLVLLQTKFKLFLKRQKPIETINITQPIIQTITRSYNDERYKLNKIESEYLIVNKYKRDKIIKMIRSNYHKSLNDINKLVQKKNVKIIDLRNQVYDLKLKLNSLEEILIIESKLKNSLQIQIANLKSK